MNVKPGIYQHFKGKKYKFLGIGFDSNDLRQSVLYQGLYHESDVGEHPIFIRPLAEFLDTVDRPNYKGPRFKALNEAGPYVCKDCGAKL